MDTPALDTWTALNDRQRSYLRLIYRVDQQGEQEEKQQAFRGQRRPAEQWRWLLYGDLNFERTISSELKQVLKEEGLVDPGTGSTFEALEQRQLIQCRGDAPELYIKLTPWGRKVARAGLGITLPKRTPKGMLSQLAWEALVLAYTAGDDGVKAEWRYRYGGIHITTWERLQDHPNGPLVKRVQGPSNAQECDRMCLTPIGLEFYCQQWERYQAVYVDVDAPHPTPQDIEAIEAQRGHKPVDMGMMVRSKRGSRGIRETAQEIDVSPTTLSRFENGKEVDTASMARILEWVVAESSKPDHLC